MWTTRHMLEVVFLHANLENSFDAYCGPMSLRRTSVMPCQAKIDFSTAIVALDVVEESLYTSGYLEKLADSDLV